MKDKVSSQSFDETHRENCNMQIRIPRSALRGDETITLAIDEEGDRSWTLSGGIRLTEVSESLWDYQASDRVIQRSIALDQMLEEDLRALERAGLIERVIDVNGIVRFQPRRVAVAHSIRLKQPHEAL